MRIIITWWYRNWFLICLGLCLIQTDSALGQLHCLNYTSQDGLPSDFLICANEDQDGFMWFGSSNGICKFDGFTFDNYSFLDAENSPGGNSITVIEIDLNNDLWVGTQDGGIFHLDRKKDVWENFVTSKSDYHQLKGNEIFFIHSDQNGKIWYGGDKSGLGCIDPIAQSHINYRLDTLPRRDTWVNRVFDMVEDSYDPNILHLVGQGYIYQFNKETKRFTTPHITEGPNEHKDFIFNPLSIVQISADEFLVGCLHAGIKSFNQKTGVFQDVYPREKDNSEAWWANVFRGGDNEVWIADRNEGVVRVNKNLRDIDLYRPEPFNRNGLLKGAYHSIFFASNGQTWVMTSEGLSLIVPQYQAFQYFGKNVDGPNIFQDIKSIPNTENFIGCFGGRKASLKILDKNMNVLSTIKVENGNEQYPVMYKSESYQDDFLCLADQLYTFDLETEILSLKSIDGLPKNVTVKDFLVGVDQELWLLLSSGALLRYDDLTQKSNLYQFDGYENLELHKVFYHGMSMVGEQIWIATHEELIVFDPQDGHSTYLYFENNTIKSRKAEKGIIDAGGSVKQVIPIDQNCAWVMTVEEGIYKVCTSAPDSFVIEEHRDKRNLSQLLGPIEMIKGESNDYWIATKNGLVHADSNLIEFRIFNQQEGLKNSRLKSGVTRVRDELFIGMPKGFARVNTKDLLKEKTAGKIIIVQATVGGSEIDRVENREFNHQQNDLIVKVASPNYHEARHVVFAHRLINHSDDWKYSDVSENIFHYDKLSPGDYTFEVKCKSPSTQWSPVESKHFTIRAPFWQRTWFLLVTAIFLSAIIICFYQWNLKRKLQQEKIKTQIAELEGKALRAQMNPHFLFNSLNSIKSLILLDRTKEGIIYLTKFSRMVREILSLSKEKEISLQKELELLGIYLDMESLRFQGKFEYQVNVDPEVSTYKVIVPPLLIQPFVENSIWHGLLHKEGNAHLKIDIWQNKGTLYIAIKDNGIGRKAAAQIKSKKSLYNKSSEGLKLSLNRMKLVSEFADIEIQDLYEDGRSSGTIVTLKLPVDYE